MNQTIVSIIETEIPASCKDVFAVVTNNKEVKWRSDLKTVEVINKETWIEIDHSNHKTHFSLLKKIEEKEYAFTIKNEMLEGVWSGIFSKTDSGTKIVFKEEIQVKNFLIRTFFAKSYLKKMQKQYIKDLTQFFCKP